MVWQDDRKVSCHQVPNTSTGINLNLVLRSATKLSYSNVQDVIDGKSLGDVPVAPEHNAGDIAHDIKILDDLAKQLRERRFQAGAITGESLELNFTLDESGHPIDCGSYERTESNMLVEEVDTQSSRNDAYTDVDVVHAGHEHRRRSADRCTLP